MPLTELDEKAALIVVDLQKGIVGMVPETGPEVVAKSVELVRAFRKRGLPVVMVNVVEAAPGRTDAGMFRMRLPDDFAELVPELEVQPEDILIRKRRVGAFLGTDLQEQLQARGVTQVFLTGIATGSGVESTARSAHDLGYHVVFVTDAMADRDAETHAFCVEKRFPRMGETETTANVLSRLAQ